MVEDISIFFYVFFLIFPSFSSKFHFFPSFFPDSIFLPHFLPDYILYPIFFQIIFWCSVFSICLLSHSKSHILTQLPLCTRENIQTSLLVILFTFIYILFFPFIFFYFLLFLSFLLFFFW